MEVEHRKQVCKCPKGIVIIELTEHEAAHLADFFDDTDAKNTASWSAVGTLARKVIELAGQW